jgi:hypothetical protein
MADHPSFVLGACEEVIACVKEYYEWLLPIYLPQRFPAMFVTLPQNPGPVLENLATKQCYPLVAPSDPLNSLATIGELIQEDVMFLLPAKDGSDYILKGFVNCFANGPSSKNRMHSSVTDIHGNVPGFKRKLGSPVARFMSKLKAGEFVRRHNVRKLALLETLFSI